MKLLCEPGFTMEERQEFREIIFDNILCAFQMVFDARSEWGVDYESENSLVTIDFCDFCYLYTDFLVAARADLASMLSSMLWLCE